MSGLTKKIIYTDKALSSILGVSEGALVSYADISKGLHRYIKERDLKNPHPVQPQSSSATPTSPPQSSPAIGQEGQAVCKDCGEQIPAGAVFCDMCGVKQ
jgi:hypothetical protein